MGSSPPSSISGRRTACARRPASRFRFRSVVAKPRSRGCLACAAGCVRRIPTQPARPGRNCDLAIAGPSSTHPDAVRQRLQRERLRARRLHHRQREAVALRIAESFWLALRMRPEPGDRGGAAFRAEHAQAFPRPAGNRCRAGSAGICDVAYAEVRRQQQGCWSLLIYGGR